MIGESHLSTAPLPGLEARLAEPANADAVRGRVACPGVLLVGRAPTADVRLPEDDLQASRQHFRVELDPSNCRLTNLSKEQGTFVNGMLVRSECDLRHGDLVRASKSVFVVQVLRGGVPVEFEQPATVIWQPTLEATAPHEQPPPSPPTPPSPIQLPGYRLIRLLGTGGMGNVWLAEDRAGRSAACKLVRPELASHSEVSARFRRETNHLRDLRHRHIVGFREAGEWQGLLYLVMEYVDGANLADLLTQQGQFEVRRAMRLACQLLDALKEAHNNGIVHRDVKPSNILVHNHPEGEEVRLADFGMAKVYQPTDTPSLTLPGVIGGTLAFAAPEMVTDFRKAGPLADQYGAAATLYMLLSGRQIHEAANAVHMLDAIRNRDATPLEQRRPGLPTELTAAIHRALSRDPMRRFPTVQAFRDVLLRFADS